jgi:DNA-binding transcriptional LysR family regulator
MTLKQLSTFFWVCRLGGFAAAAARLNATQSTVSMRVQELEASLGVTLIDRSPRAIRPTPRGAEILAYVERILALTTEMEYRISDPEILSGNVRLGVSELIAVTWLSDLVSEIAALYPKVSVDLVVNLSQEHLDRVTAGELDVALVPGPARGLSNVSLGTVDFAWMASPRLGLSGRVLTPHELSAWPMLGLTRQSKLYFTVSDWFDGAGAPLPPMRFCNSTSVVAVLTASGLGTCYLPLGTLTDKLIASGELDVLRTEPDFPRFEYSAVYDPQNPLPLARVIAELAGRLSTFNKQAPH